MVRFKFGKPKEWGVKLLSLFLKAKSGEKITPADALTVIKSVDDEPPQQKVIELIDDIIYRCGQLEVNFAAVQGLLARLTMMVIELPGLDESFRQIILDKLRRMKNYCNRDEIYVVPLVLERIKVDIQKGVRV